jgi:PadR family transcriptional regulator, regulatory protein PadR
MTDRTALGEFEHHVLLAALRLGTGAYTTSIMTELEERTGREVAASAVYIALRRLESSGLVQSRLKAGVELGERRERRYIRVTPAGIARVREARRRLERLWEGLPALAGGKV